MVQIEVHETFASVTHEYFMSAIATEDVWNEVYLAMKNMKRPFYILIVSQEEYEKHVSHN